MTTPVDPAPDSAPALLDWLRRRGVGVVVEAGAARERRFRLDAAERLAAPERRFVRAFLRRHRRAVLHAAEIATLPPPEERARLRFPPDLAVVTALGERGTVERVEGRTVYVRHDGGRSASPPRPHDYTDLVRPDSLAAL